MILIHKRFTDKEVRELLKRYIEGKVKRKHIEKILGIGNFISEKWGIFQLPKMGIFQLPLILVVHS